MACSTPFASQQVTLHVDQHKQGTSFALYSLALLRNRTLRQMVNRVSFG